APSTLLLDVDVRVAAESGERRAPEPPPHLRATGDHRCRRVEAYALLGWLDDFEPELTRSKDRQQRDPRDLRTFHHVDQQEIVGQDPIQGFRSGLDQCGEERPFRREWVQCFLHTASASRARDSPPARQSAALHANQLSGYGVRQSTSDLPPAALISQSSSV